VRAVAYAKPDTPEVRKPVTYFYDDGNEELKLDMLEGLKLVAPLNTIQGCGRNHRFWYLILFYFLTKRSFDVIHFSVRGLE
jgi:hypothetical protein